VPKVRSSLRNRAEETLFLLAARGIRALSRERADSIGRRAGLAFRRLSASRRALVDRNLARALPELGPEERECLSRDVFAHFGRLAFDLVATVGEPAASILGRVEVSGEEHAKAAYASGRGVFFLTAHLGNWELAALITSLLGMPIKVVVRPLDNPLLDRHLRAFRESGGNTVVPKATAARELFRILRSGGGVGILMDQHARTPDAVPSPFFGRPASTTTVVARLADRTGALVVPVFTNRIGPGRYRVEYGAPLDVETLSPPEREAGSLTARLNAITESLVRRAPDQWLWLHNRWRLD